MAAQDTHNGLFIIEQVSQRKGGPPRHLHHAGQMEKFVIQSAMHRRGGEPVTVRTAPLAALLR